MIEILENLKSKLKSTAFWVTLLAVVGSVLMEVGGYIPTEYAAIAVAVAAGAYAISRGMAKYSADLKNGLLTTEFWMGIVSAVILAIQTGPGDLSTKEGGLLGLILAVVYTISRGLAHNPYAETVGEPIDVWAPDEVAADEVAQ